MEPIESTVDQYSDDPYLAQKIKFLEDMIQSINNPLDFNLNFEDYLKKISTKYRLDQE